MPIPSPTTSFSWAIVQEVNKPAELMIGVLSISECIHDYEYTYNNKASKPNHIIHRRPLGVK